VICFNNPGQCALFVLTLVAVLLSECGLRSSNKTDTSSQRVASSTPPFRTQEPKQYTAVRIITSEASFPDSRPPLIQTSTFRISKLGPQRREESEVSDQTRLVYLENEQGFFVLATDLKLYTDLSVGSSVNGSELLLPPPPTHLLSLAMIEATYEDLGTEYRNNKNVRKYRVNHSAASPGSQGRSSTFVWIDEQLGMPIRAEWMTTQEGVMRKTVNELRDISFNVEAGLFEIPSDYRRIGRDEFYGRFRGH